MHEFCPLCSKNGIEAKIKAFQINFNEAVLMCSTDQCLWPAGCQELAIINRSVEEDWSKFGEKVATENLNNYPHVGKTVPDQSTVLTEDNSCVFQEDSTTISKPCDLFLDTNIDNESNLASQPVDSVPINDKAGVSPTNNNENSDITSVVYTKSTNLGNVMLIVNGISTSLDNNFVPVKTNSLSNNNSSRLSRVSKDLSLSPKLLNRTRKKAHSFKKFNLLDLQKAKTTNVDKGTKINLVARNKELSKENLKKMNITLSNSEYRVDLDSNSSSTTESDNSETVKSSDSEFNLDEFLNGICNDISGKTDVESSDEYDWIDALVF